MLHDHSSIVIRLIFIIIATPVGSLEEVFLVLVSLFEFVSASLQWWGQMFLQTVATSVFCLFLHSYLTLRKWKDCFIRRGTWSEEDTGVLRPRASPLVTMGSTVTTVKSAREFLGREETQKHNGDTLILHLLILFLLKLSLLWRS